MTKWWLRGAASFAGIAALARCAPEAEPGGSTTDGGRSEAGRSSQAGRSAGDAGRSPGGAGLGGGAGGDFEPGSSGQGTDAGVGGTLGEGGAGRCPEWDACPITAGRGNACGGVVLDARYVLGTGFDEFEGARVVSHAGHATVTNGNFGVFVGLSSGCPPPPAVYRIDVSANGRCDDDDLVYEAVPVEFSGIAVTSASRGTPKTCSEFPGGYDLEFPIDPGCFLDCGELRVALFAAGDDPLLARDTAFMDVSPRGHGFAGLVEPGRDYTLRYFWSWFGGCTATTAVWERPFTAVAGVNTVPVAADLGEATGACF